MQDSPIQIGPISLQGFEIPSSVRFGGRFRAAVHILYGGRRIVERLGPDDGEVEFHGTFSGANAESRVRSFDNLRQSGEIVWLTWASFRRRVVIKNFVADYHSPWWIPYTVSCLVVQQMGLGVNKTSTLSGLVTADLGSALSAVAGTTISLASLQGTLSSANAFDAGTSDQVNAVAGVHAALTAINNNIAFQSALVTTPTVGMKPDRLSSTLAATVASAGLLAASVNARSYIGRIGVNLNN